MTKLAIFQLNSLEDYKHNLDVIYRLGREAKEKGAEYFFLPECFLSMSNGLRPSPHLIEGEGELYQAIRKLSLDFKVFLIGGSAATKKDSVVVNRAFNFSPEGDDLGHYDKINLFSCDIKKSGGNNNEKESKKIDEADIYTPGTQPLLIEAGELKVGLGICFDLRYPEMAREYVRSGANLLTFSSAFTVPTGKAHWHTLVRARAIENQCFVVASAQWGKHNERIQTYGHSLVVDPWGDILVDAKEGESVHVVDIDLGRIAEIRSAVKVFK